MCDIKAESKKLTKGNVIRRLALVLEHSSSYWENGRTTMFIAEIWTRSWVDFGFPCLDGVEVHLYSAFVNLLWKKKILKA